MARTAGHRGSGLRCDLRRCLKEWSAAALLRRVHVALVRRMCSGPEAAAAAWDVVVDSCSVRAKRGGELTGPYPTDRAKRGTKYHVRDCREFHALGMIGAKEPAHATPQRPSYP